MAITTSPVTMRVNKKVLTAAQKRAKAEGCGYQTVINKVLADSFGVTLPPIDRTPKRKHSTTELKNALETLLREAKKAEKLEGKRTKKA